MVTMSGFVIMIASVALENAEIDDSQTPFVDKRYDENGQEIVEEVGTDDHSKYEKGKKLIAHYKFDSVIIIMFLCDKKEQQFMFGKVKEQQ